MSENSNNNIDPKRFLENIGLPHQSFLWATFHELNQGIKHKPHSVEVRGHLKSIDDLMSSVPLIQQRKDFRLHEEPLSTTDSQYVLEIVNEKYHVVIEALGQRGLLAAISTTQSPHFREFYEANMQQWEMQPYPEDTMVSYIRKVA